MLEGEGRRFEGNNINALQSGSLPPGLSHVLRSGTNVAVWATKTLRIWSADGTSVRDIRIPGS